MSEKLLKELGITYSQFLRILRGKNVKPRIIETHFNGNEFTFGIVSDTHFCSTEERINELHTFYKICADQDIETIVHAADLIAGCFEGQTTFLLRKGINPTIGGWIVRVSIANDKKHTITSLTPK